MVQRTIVVAMNRDYVIGVGNKLPWHIPEDLQHFKALTLNKVVIMGRKTFESIGKPLPNRINVVITRNPEQLSTHLGQIVVYTSIVDAYDAYDDMCVIGGREIYRQSLDYCNEMYITWVDHPIANSDDAVLFPEIDWNVWKLISSNEVLSSAGIKCTFCHYIRQ